MNTVNFLGLECSVLENDTLRLLVTRTVGPRIVSLSIPGGENLLAELPDGIIDTPGTGIFHFYGGHRLWHAPEVPARTYLPDDSPVEITLLENGLLATPPTEPQTGLQKSIEIQLSGEPARVVVTHRLTNRGLWPVTCAPWAITQCKTGGTAILPQIVEDTGVLPNRSLALWSYTEMKSPHLEWGSRYILLHARMEAPFKIGFPNPRGWLAYWWNGTLFVKQAAYQPQADYFDYGSSSECYCNQHFLELETLAPVTTIEPGETATHVETWSLYKDIDPPHTEREAEALRETLGLE